MKAFENREQWLKKIEQALEKVLSGYLLTEDEAIELMSIPLSEEEVLESLFHAGGEVRKKWAGDSADLCSIINAKSGKCSEDCRYCAQSAHYTGGAEIYSLLAYDDILKKAQEVEAQGVHRFSLVTSGRGIESEQELLDLAAIYSRLKRDTSLRLCASHGIVSTEQAKVLKAAGVEMYHHNIETSRAFYPKICTTHTFEDRINTLKAVAEAGVEVCSGGIIGMGEDLRDRVSMASELRSLSIRSIPINILSPIYGTPFGHLQTLKPLEILRTLAVFRLMLPEAKIRYAGGRAALMDYQERGLRAGVNAALVGDFLTTLGSKVSEDKAMLQRAGYRI